MFKITKNRIYSVVYYGEGPSQIKHFLAVINHIQRKEQLPQTTRYLCNTYSFWGWSPPPHPKYKTVNTSGARKKVPNYLDGLIKNKVAIYIPNK